MGEVTELQSVDSLDTTASGDTKIRSLVFPSYRQLWMLPKHTDRPSFHVVPRNTGSETTSVMELPWVCNAFLRMMIYMQRKWRTPTGYRQETASTRKRDLGLFSLILQSPLYQILYILNLSIHSLELIN